MRAAGFVGGSEPLATTMLTWAVIGAMLAFLLDMLGLDLPLFAQRRSRAEENRSS